MNAERIVSVVSFATASLVLLVGIIVLLNIFPAPISEGFRITLGGCMALYGMYRIWTTWRRQRALKENDEE